MCIRDRPDPETLARTDYRSKKELTGDVRLVEAGGDCCACCGTHLTRTGEVGLIKICLLYTSRCV